ncbi:hypothetical protein AB0M43_06200 [Longispora sp. NPDC051575]|uniref:hypothetical protein n=1 Tax=Longispora sp. NPDC051575 TaxID=3154943 RepID=UPI0034427528
MARSLSRSMPVGGVCVTAERDRLAILRVEARRRRCRLVVVDPEEVTDEEMAAFSWITFKDNVAIALAVARLCGVRRDAALTGMWAAPPDPGVLTVDRFRLAGGTLAVANVFAANDPASTLQNIHRLHDQELIGRPLQMVINCRPDRVERNAQMGTLVGQVAPDRVILIGEPTRSARATVPDPWQDRVLDLGGRRPARQLLDEIVAGMAGDTSLVTVGNIHGQGELLLAELATLPRAVPATPHRRTP